MHNNSQGRRDRPDQKPITDVEDTAQSGCRGLRAGLTTVDEAIPPEQKAAIDTVLNQAVGSVSAEPQTGVITDCIRLNIREKPNGNADVVAVIDALSEVVVDMENSTQDFYKVCTAAGIEGFCMKKYVALRR